MSPFGDNTIILPNKSLGMDKFYTYEDLPVKNIALEIQHHLTDDIILEYLNKIVKNSNLLLSIEYHEEAKSDEPTGVSITFKLLKYQKED